MNVRLRRSFFSPAFPVYGLSEITSPSLRLFSFSSCSDSDYCCPDSCQFCCSLACAFPGCPPGGAGCRERSQRSCLRPGGLPSLTQNPRLQRPERSRRLCRAVTCALGIPATGRRDVRSNAVSQTALHVVAAGACPLLCPVPYSCLSPCRRGLIQPQPAALTV